MKATNILTCMVDAARAHRTRRAVDEAALSRIRGRLAVAPTPPWLHTEVARRMAERLPIFRRPPQRIIDWYGRDNASEAVLQQACPQAAVLRVDPEEMQAQAPMSRPAWWSPRRWQRSPTWTPAASLPPDAGDLLWANMGLHWVADPLAEMRRWHRVLPVDGVLMFATVGPGTLPALRQRYEAAGWPPPAAALVDMHDLGDMLVEAGFAEPVMDQETLTLTWPDAEAMLKELRGLGGNANPGRAAGLRTPRWKRELVIAFTPSPAARPAMAFEIVYGHAMRGRPKLPVSSETRVGLEAMRSILRG